jgi:hypothetical protein
MAAGRWRRSRCWLSWVVVLVGLLAGPVESHARPFKVLEFNIEYGGKFVRDGAASVIGWVNLVRVIKTADADVVILCEAEASVAALALAAGYKFYDSRMQLLSKFPLREPMDAHGAYTAVEVTSTPAYVIVANTHLLSEHYGPYKWAAEQGTMDAVALADPASATKRDILQVENHLRLPGLQVQLGLPRTYTSVPILVGGDFNVPSHLDYTKEWLSVRRIPEVGRAAAFPWPVSVAMEAAGFHDSFRDMHPWAGAQHADALRDNPAIQEALGFTSRTSRRPIYGEHGREQADRPDRIDFIYYASFDGNHDLVAPNSVHLHVTSSVVIGEATTQIGGRALPVSGINWPSDHRALLSTFELTPGALHPVPVFTTSSRLLAAPAGGDAATAPHVEDVMASNWPQGNELWVSNASYPTGTPIVIGWSNAPAYRWDAIAIYDDHAQTVAPTAKARMFSSDSNDLAFEPEPLMSFYINGPHAGTGNGPVSSTITIDANKVRDDSDGAPWPLPVTHYKACYVHEHVTPIRVGCVPFDVR